MYYYFQTLTYTSPHSLSTRALSCTNCFECIYAYMYTHIPKYSLLSSFNVTSMYDFGVDFLTLVN